MCRYETTLTHPLWNWKWKLEALNCGTECVTVLARDRIPYELTIHTTFHTEDLEKGQGDSR